MLEKIVRREVEIVRRGNEEGSAWLRKMAFGGREVDQRTLDRVQWLFLYYNKCELKSLRKRTGDRTVMLMCVQMVCKGIRT